MSDNLHTSALHPSEVHATTGADGKPILTTGPMTPSLDFNPSDFKGPQLAPAAVPSHTSTSHSSSSHTEHSNPHPVVAKSGIDLSTGVQRPAETHANSGTFSADSTTGSSTTGTGPTVTGLRQRAGSVSKDVGDKASAVGNNVSEKASALGSNVSQQASALGSNVSQQASALGNNVSASLNSASRTVADQAQHVAEHPAVQNAKQAALKQTDSFRETLGRYPIIVNAERQTGIDRVALVVGGILLYVFLIPLNLFGLALPTTQLLTFLPPTFLALRTLDQPNEERTKTLLSYFVVFGFVQFAESLMAGFLERRIPQYYTVKLLFLAYLIHPKTKGARKIHASVFRPLLARAQQAQKSTPGYSTTPPTTKPSSGPTSVNSPTFPSSNSGASADIPLSRASGFSGTGPSSTAHAGAPAGYGIAPASTQGSNIGGGQIHLPSGGGSGVGQEVPKY